MERRASLPRISGRRVRAASYPRVNTNVLCGPAGIRLTHYKRNAQDFSLGGMRVFWAERFEVGSQLDLDVFLADRSRIRYLGAGRLAGRARTGGSISV